MKLNECVFEKLVCSHTTARSWQGPGCGADAKTALFQ